MDLTRAPYALTTALFVLATACDGKHSAINEYDCFASSNGCPIGFEARPTPTAGLYASTAPGTSIQTRPPESPPPSEMALTDPTQIRIPGSC